jgi:hypothetical protein
MLSDWNDAACSPGQLPQPSVTGFVPLLAPSNSIVPDFSYPFPLPTFPLRRVFAAPQMVFRVGIALLASAQEQLCAMPFERLVAALNGRKFPILNKQPDALMKVRGAALQASASIDSCLKSLGRQWVSTGMDTLMHDH